MLIWLLHKYEISVIKIWKTREAATEQGLKKKKKRNYKKTKLYREDVRVDERRNWRDGSKVQQKMVYE